MSTSTEGHLGGSTPLTEGEPCAQLVGWSLEEANALLEGRESRHQEFYQSPSDLCFSVWCDLGKVAIIDTASPDWQAFDAKHRDAASKGRRHPGIPNTAMGDLDCGEMGPKGERCAHRYNHAGRCLWVGEGHHPNWEPAVLPEIAKPQGPTDAEIVEAWDRVMRAQENAAPLLRRCPDVLAVDEGPCAGIVLTKARYQAARSRELKRRAAESREKDRQRVVCEGTLAEDY